MILEQSLIIRYSVFSVDKSVREDVTFRIEYGAMTLLAACPSQRTYPFMFAVEEWNILTRLACAIWVALKFFIVISPSRSAVANRGLKVDLELHSSTP
jgi:hypothetical protein